MDWYYPVLAGILTGEQAHRRLTDGWDRFVAPQHGVHCVDHEPWVTVGETAELALTLTATGNRPRASTLLATLGALRTPDGEYWTGYNYATNTIWPLERTTWSAAAVLLATAALHDDGPTIATFVPTMSASWQR